MVKQPTKQKSKAPVKKVFNPQDRYFVNEEGWWFYTVDAIGGPFNTKPECVDACRYHLQTK